MEFSFFDNTLWCGLGALLFWLFFTVRHGSFRQHALLIVRQAEREAEQKKADLALELQTIKNQHDQQIQHDLFHLESQENQLKSQFQKLSREVERVKKDQARLFSLQKEVEEKERCVNEAHLKTITTLEQVGQLSYDEARSAIIQKAEENSRFEIERQKDNWQRCFESDCQSQALNLILSAIERKKHVVTKDTNVTELPLKDRSFIPRCIGKEGRNIQTIEELLRVSLIIDEQTPRLLISAHDVQSRFLAKTTIERLIEAEKVTPVTIRAAHEEALSSFSHHVEELGREAIRTCGHLNTIPQEVILTLGRLSFRSSSGQNVLKHSIEVAEMMAILAAELGLKSEKAKAMGLFHDIGKGLSTEWGNSHARAGKTFLEKWGVDSDIANAVAAHHGEEVPVTEEARLLPVCDRLSAQLPGVRHPQEPAFLIMVQQCEERTKDLPEVLSSWAHYAGTHIELVIRHTPVEQTAPLLQAVREALFPANIALPVNITLLHTTNRKLDIYPHGSRE
jgi:ribonuclease Y